MIIFLFSFSGLGSLSSFSSTGAISKLSEEEQKIKILDKFLNYDHCQLWTLNYESKNRFRSE